MINIFGNKDKNVLNLQDQTKQILNTMEKSKYLIPLFCIFFILQISISQGAGKKNKKEQGYQFTHKIEIPTTPVKDQASSGTCWSYATTSFIETEIIRLGKGEHDISEMFFVRYAYPQKALKYMRYQGLANFSEGGQAHDVFNIIKEYGLVPEEVYTGLNYGYDYHKHGEMVDVMTGILKNGIENKNAFTGKCLDIIDASLDIYLGEIPEKFTYKEVEYTPISFAKEIGVNPNDYIELTSYSAYPFYEKIDLEVPDNWSHDTYYNIPLDAMMQIINNAFKNGLSVNWDGDVSEAGFSHSNGVAIVPERDPQEMAESERLKWESMTDEEQVEMLYDFSEPRKEMVIDQKIRQKSFDNFKTTDDHLMHLIGTATDQNNTLYYITKNSWADDSNKWGGKLYMSESFIKLKTIAIQVHKNAIPEEIKSKINLN